MKAFRREPGIFTSTHSEEIRAGLEVKELTLKFGGITALNKVSLSVHKGDLFSIIGPNGSGKTTLLDCITGRLKPQGGRISFNGREITRLPTHRIAQAGIGRTYHTAELFPRQTVLANMMMARHLLYRYNVGQSLFFLGRARDEEVHHRRIVEEIIDFLGIQFVRKRPVCHLPHGMRKRVELGCALAMEPSLLMLDEPFEGMVSEDLGEMARFLVELNNRCGQTIIVVEQDLSSVANISEKIAVFDFGVKVAEGSPDFVQNHPQVIKAYHGNISEIT